ncbi:hypothetical protein K435DRAFT_793039 [Dendrothele bispora CBS 962.96]|uniref:Uncharacterized protein n=1 Tax=Dendrothele bispora (strain CBS 962.96) TaxID=1314807 RepID=A0A4V4HH97_DENBC|nr:hypothetical protein K435DRAFT_793039 [Dendrothele bispora CBS 962.96]
MLEWDQAIIRQAQLHRPRGCQPRHPKLAKEGSMALVNRIPSYHHDINTTAVTTTAFERLLLLTTCTNYTRLVIMHFHNLPVSVLALLFLQMYHTIASSISSSFSPQIKTRDDTAYDQNPNGSFFVWLPQDGYSGIPSSIIAWDQMLTSIKNTSRFNFFADRDPPQGTVQMELVFMKGDDTTWLANGEFRNRLLAEVNGLLSWLFLTPDFDFTGTVVYHPFYFFDNNSKTNGQNTTNCSVTIPPNAGCIQEWSHVLIVRRRLRLHDEEG